MARDWTDPIRSGVQGEPLSADQISSITVNGCGLLFLIFVTAVFVIRHKARTPITEPMFPKTERIEGLLTPIASPWSEPPSKNNRRVHFAKWRSGRGVLLQEEDREVRVLDEEWNCAETLELPGHLGGVFPVNENSSPPWIVFYGDYGFEAFKTMAILNADLSTTQVLDLEWPFSRTRLTRALKTSSSDNIFITYDSPPEGEKAFRGIDLEGQTLWTLPVPGYGEILSTHPRLPEVFFAGGGREMGVYRHRADGSPRPLFKCGRSLGFNQAILVGLSGGFRVVVQGKTSFLDREKLTVLDEEGDELWEALLPERVAWFALVEPAGKTPLVATITWKHRLLVFDLEGTLRSEIQLPYSDDFRARNLQAGRVGDTWMLSTTLSGEPRFYVVETSLLPGASNAAQEK